MSGGAVPPLCCGEGVSICSGCCCAGFTPGDEPALTRRRCRMVCHRPGRRFCFAGLHVRGPDAAVSACMHVGLVTPKTAVVILEGRMWTCQRSSGSHACLTGRPGLPQR